MNFKQFIDCDEENIFPNEILTIIYDYKKQLDEYTDEIVNLKYGLNEYGEKILDELEYCNINDEWEYDDSIHEQIDYMTGDHIDDIKYEVDDYGFGELLLNYNSLFDIESSIEKNCSCNELYRKLYYILILENNNLDYETYIKIRTYNKNMTEDD